MAFQSFASERFWRLYEQLRLTFSGWRTGNTNCFAETHSIPRFS
jgi:hypothetical protein